jgi:predicted transposase YbfD/YdcC
MRAGLLLGQRKVDDKSDEITAVPELLKALSIKGCVVMADALNCQKDIAQPILDGGSDYVFALKASTLPQPFLSIFPLAPLAWERGRE